MLEFHRAAEAEVTVAVIPVPTAEMDQFGIVDCDAAGRIVGFREKPPVDTDPPGTRLASMGLYVFNCDALVREVQSDAERTDSSHDFGKDVIPRMVETATVVAYDFSTNTIPDMHDGQRGYWRDVGSIDMYWRTSEDLISITPQLNLYNPRWPMLSAYYPHPPAKFVFADPEGGTAASPSIRWSPRNHHRGGRVDATDPQPASASAATPTSRVDLFDGVDVGRHATRRAIIDKGVVMPPGMTIGYDPSRPATLHDQRRRRGRRAEGMDLGEDEPMSRRVDRSAGHAARGVPARRRR